MVRCKMRVTEVTEVAGYGNGPAVETKRVRLNAVANKENATWSKWTPSGVIELSITNPEAVQHFKTGEYLFIDFSPAPATEAEETK